MPNQPKTPARTVRIDDDTWDALRDIAAAEGEPVSVVVRWALDAWIAQEPVGTTKPPPGPKARGRIVLR